jgi:hypothetical protein
LNDNPDRHSPLIMVARKNHLASARVLCELGASADDRDADGMTALLYACQRGHVNMLKFLFDRSDAALYPGTPESSDELTALTQSPLHLCAMLNSEVHCLEFLLQHKFTDVDCVAFKKKLNNSSAAVFSKCPLITPLGVAVARGKVNVAKFLIERGASINAFWNEVCPPLYASTLLFPFDRILTSGSTLEPAHSQLVNCLLCSRQGFSLKNSTGTCPMLQLLLDSGVDVNYVHTSVPGRTVCDLFVALFDPLKLLLLLRYGLDSTLLFLHAPSRIRSYIDWRADRSNREQYIYFLGIHLRFVFHLVQRSRIVRQYLEMITVAYEENHSTRRVRCFCPDGKGISFA